MPVVPPRSLGGRFKPTTKKLKKSFVRYGIFAFVLIDLFSLTLFVLGFFAETIYDFIVQLNIFILLFVLRFRPEKLILCKRKKMAYTLLIINYIIGMIAVTFEMSKHDYYPLVGFSLLGLSAVLILVSLKKNND